MLEVSYNCLVNILLNTVKDDRDDLVFGSVFGPTVPDCTNRDVGIVNRVPYPV